MKRSFAWLFAILLLITACAPKVEATETPVHIQGVTVDYDSFLAPEAPEVLSLVNLNHVTITAPEGTKLDYKVDMGTVNVTGLGTNLMTVDLVTGPAQVQILVTKCADVCPTLVHFLHEVTYSQ
ncbi:MAG: hypothetical protein HYV90_04845 [Candidatus Woesebacteria bacterium]|nr:MAG: hypothetical protein HYV90_04845 [Candidatus Woesebacteria bacterium]